VKLRQLAGGRLTRISRGKASGSFGIRRESWDKLELELCWRLNVQMLILGNCVAKGGMVKGSQVRPPFERVFAKAQGPKGAGDEVLGNCLRTRKMPFRTRGPGNDVHEKWVRPSCDERAEEVAPKRCDKLVEHARTMGKLVE